MAAAPEVNASSPKRPSVNGGPSPFWRRCVATGSTAPCVFDGPINGASFRAYVEQVLVPILTPSDVVILDNLGSHKGRGVREAIRAVGASLVFLPKYSPDLNPIEQVFAKFKTLLRKAEARSYESDLATQAVKSSPSTRTAECAAYLKNAGYG